MNFAIVIFFQNEGSLELKSLIGIKSLQQGDEYLKKLGFSREEDRGGFSRWVNMERESPLSRTLVAWIEQCISFRQYEEDVNWERREAAECHQQPKEHNDSTPMAGREMRVTLGDIINHRR